MVWFWFDDEKGGSMDDIYKVAYECWKTSAIYGSCEMKYGKPDEKTT